MSQALRSGALVAVRPGAYFEPPQGSRWERRRALALARIAAVHAQLEVEHVLSHQSAAMLWGLPMVDDGSQVHVVQRTASHRRGAHDVVRHEHRLDGGDVVLVGGLPVTSRARTVVDCALTLAPSAGLVVVDAGLRAGGGQARMAELVASMASYRGITRARAVLEAADDGAESPGESLTRHALLRAGFPVPSTQVLVRTVDGPTWGDVSWEQWRLLVEYDGVAKYTANGGAAEAVVAERRREVVVERADWRVLRVTAADLKHPASLVADVLRRAPARTADTLRPRPALADTVRPRRARNLCARPSLPRDGLAHG